ncbi:MAG: hypothetical protein ACC657_14400, partial [Thiohalomonadales bacterium]
LADGTVVNVDIKTIMNDQSVVADKAFNLEAVKVDDYLEIKAIDNAGVITAVLIVRKDAPLAPGMTRVEFKDTVTTVSPTGPKAGTLKLADGTVVNVDIKTIMNDQSVIADPAFNLEAVLVNDYLEIKAIDNAGVITAILIVRKDVPPVTPGTGTVPAM